MIPDLTWIVAVMVIAGLVLVVGAVDLYLSMLSQPTISAFLRLHPLYFWIPCLLINLMLTGLAIHLFGSN